MRHVNDALKIIIAIIFGIIPSIAINAKIPTVSDIKIPIINTIIEGITSLFLNIINIFLCGWVIRLWSTWEIFYSAPKGGWNTGAIGWT